MRLLRLVLVTLVGVGLSCQRQANSDEARTECKKLAKLAALQLPRTLAVPGGDRDFEWAEGVAEAASMYFPSEMPVYRVVRLSPSETARAVAASLGDTIENASASESESLDEHTDFVLVGQAGVSAYPDGNFSLRYRGGHPNRVSPSGEAEAPGIAETIKIVGGYLDEHPGLLPEGASQVEVVPVGTTTSTDPKTGRLRVSVRNRGVVYRRFHNGFPEGRLTVMVNPKGEVWSVSSNMRGLALIGSYPILTPSEAMALNSPWATSEGLEAVDIVGPAQIDHVEMEYWDGATGWELDTIQPVYRFRGTVHNAAGNQGKFTVTVPAVRPEYFE